MRDCSSQLKYANEIRDKIFSRKVYAFSSIVPYELKEKTGVYVI